MISRIIFIIQSNLTIDLLKKQYRSTLSKDAHITEGHCYIAAEALYHLTNKSLTPYVISSKIYGVTHWFLKDKQGSIYDPTAEQFGGEVPLYGYGRPCGFLTSKPSKRAAILIDRVKNDSRFDRRYIQISGKE